jgi:hypothetical protein
MEQIYLTIEPSSLQRGGEVVVSFDGPECELWTGGLYADLEEKIDGGWQGVFHLAGLRDGGGSRGFADAVPWGQTHKRLALGVRGSLRFRIPHVTAGMYRLRRDYVRPGPIEQLAYGELLITE